jgi:hypothetical protein
MRGKAWTGVAQVRKGLRPDYLSLLSQGPQRLDELTNQSTPVSIADFYGHSTFNCVAA